jgi:hypothetical protein
MNLQSRLGQSHLYVRRKGAEPSTVFRGCKFESAVISMRLSDAPELYGNGLKNQLRKAL